MNRHSTFCSAHKIRIKLKIHSLQNFSGYSFAGVRILLQVLDARFLVKVVFRKVQLFFNDLARKGKPVTPCSLLVNARNDHSICLES